MPDTESAGARAPGPDARSRRGDEESGATQRAPGLTQTAEVCNKNLLQRKYLTLQFETSIAIRYTCNAVHFGKLSMIQRQANTESAGARHRERRGPTQRAPGHDAETAGSAGARHRDRRGLTQRAPGPDTESAGARRTKRRGPTQSAPGPDTQSAGARHTELRCLTHGAPRPTERRGPVHSSKCAAQKNTPDLRSVTLKFHIHFYTRKQAEWEFLGSSCLQKNRTNTDCRYLNIYIWIYIYICGMLDKYVCHRGIIDKITTIHVFTYVDIHSTYPITYCVGAEFIALDCAGWNFHAEKNFRQVPLRGSRALPRGSHQLRNFFQIHKETSWIVLKFASPPCFRCHVQEPCRLGSP